MHRDSAKGFHIHPPHVPEGVPAGQWFRELFVERPDDFSRRPYDREQWDVIDANGKLVTSWRLPAKTTLVAVGQGAVYTVRTDEDDLRYLQRVEIGR